MIVITSKDLQIRWIDGEWRDQAGHIFKMGSKAELVSKEHGTFYESQWKIPGENVSA